MHIFFSNRDLNMISRCTISHLKTFMLAHLKYHFERFALWLFDIKIRCDCHSFCGCYDNQKPDNTVPL